LVKINFSINKGDLNSTLSASDNDEEYSELEESKQSSNRESRELSDAKPMIRGKTRLDV
jgi:hypothetical protein